MPSGYSATTKSNILLPPALIYVASALWGATRGSPSFNPNRRVANVAFDGKSSDVAGLDMIVGWDGVFSFRLIELSATVLARLEPGSTSATVGGVTTVTPPDAGVLIPTANLLTAVRMLWKRGDGAYEAILFPKALVTTWSIETGSADTAEIPVELHARLDMDAVGATTDDCPYVIEQRSALP